MHMACARLTTRDAHISALVCLFRCCRCYEYSTEDSEPYQRVSGYLAKGVFLPCAEPRCETWNHPTFGQVRVTTICSRRCARYGTLKLQRAHHVLSIRFGLSF